MSSWHASSLSRVASRRLASRVRGRARPRDGVCAGVGEGEGRYRCRRGIVARRHRCVALLSWSFVASTSCRCRVVVRHRGNCRVAVPCRVVVTDRGKREGDGDAGTTLSSLHEGDERVRDRGRGRRRCGEMEMEGAPSSRCCVALCRVVVVVQIEHTRGCFFHFSPYPGPARRVRVHRGYGCGYGCQYRYEGGRE